MKCKHDFKCISNASGGWQSKSALVQCLKCYTVFSYDEQAIELDIVKINDDALDMEDAE